MAKLIKNSNVAFDTTGMTPLPDSLKKAPEGVAQKPISDNQIIEVTLSLRAKNIPDATVLQNPTFTPISREAYAAEYGADDTDIHSVTAYVATHGLSVIHTDAGKRTVQIKGEVGQLRAAFGVQLYEYTAPDGNKFHGRTGYVYVPDSLKDVVEGIFGFDNRMTAKAHFQILKEDVTTPLGMTARGLISDAAAGPAKKKHPVTTNFYATEIATLYNFPTNATGAGQCVAIIELDGGHTQKDLDTYFKLVGLKSPTVISVGVDGAMNKPIGDPSSADGEVLLDIEVVGSVAPNAKIVMYYAPNTDQGFLNAILAAVHDNVNKPSVISISWGNPEVNWTAQSLKAYNDAFQAASLLGVTICAASGDQGSSDGYTTDSNVHVDFPSSSPFVLACGGTKLTAANKIITAESVWNESSTSAGGGGISDTFPLPDYQKNAKVAVSISGKNFVGRGVPDVAGDADPVSGYKVIIDGKNFTIGGTSAVAPLFAGLIALMNELKKKPVGYIHPLIYAHPEIFRDITAGNNITAAGQKGFKATTGWDACTGLGVPDGKKWSKVLAGV